MQNDMRDRLVKKIAFKLYICNESDCADCEYSDIEYDKCKAMFLADSILEDGWIRPPCNIGDVVYSIRTDTKVIYSCSVCEFIINKHFENIHKECKVYIIEDGRFTYFDFSSFGKTVFFTKEEAERKLKELSENADL